MTLSFRKPDVTQKPKGFEAEFGEYQPVLFDVFSSEVVAWGFPLRQFIGPDRFTLLRHSYDMVCMRLGSWACVTRRLSHAEAIEKYGPETARETSPRGGWRSITYGTTTFRTKLPGVL